MKLAATALVAAVAAALVASPSGVDARVERGLGLANKKAREVGDAASTQARPLLATLVVELRQEAVPSPHLSATVDDITCPTGRSTRKL